MHVYLIAGVRSQQAHIPTSQQAHIPTSMFLHQCRDSSTAVPRKNEWAHRSCLLGVPPLCASPLYPPLHRAHAQIRMHVRACTYI